MKKVLSDSSSGSTKQLFFKVLSLIRLSPYILNDNMLYDAQCLNAPVTALVPDSSCSEGERELVYDYVLRKRDEQKFPTILWDMIQDVLAVDAIVSEDCCSAGFRDDGAFFALANGEAIGNRNLFDSDLRTILAACFKK